MTRLLAVLLPVFLPFWAEAGASALERVPEAKTWGAIGQVRLEPLGPRASGVRAMTVRRGSPNKACGIVVPIGLVEAGDLLRVRLTYKTVQAGPLRVSVGPSPLMRIAGLGAATKTSLTAEFPVRADGNWKLWIEQRMDRRRGEFVVYDLSAQVVARGPVDRLRVLVDGDMEQDHGGFYPPYGLVTVTKVTESGQDGIQLQACRGARMRGNAIHRSGSTGIFLLKSRESLVEDNTISTTNKGIDVQGEPSDRVTLKQNELTWNGHQIRVSGSHHALRSNVLKHSAYGGIVLADAKSCRIEKNTIEAAIREPAILLRGAVDTVVVGNRLTENSQGIVITGKSTGNTVSENWLSSNDVGISLTMGASNRILRNTLTICDRAVVIPPKWLQSNTLKDNVVRSGEPVPK